MEAEDILAVAGILVAVSTAAILPARHFGRGFGGDFGRLYGFGGDGLYYGDGYSGCYVPTPDGYAWACY